MSVSVLRYDEQAESQRTRIADYVELTKPRISVIMVTVAITAYVARWGQPDFVVIVHVDRNMFDRRQCQCDESVVRT